MMVGKSLALLSGKGGSGKTSLALSMASMLSDCGIKVLVVDCDLSTNGATYFYESNLSGQKKKIVSFFDVLIGEKYEAEYEFIRINENFDFLPSVDQITSKNIITYTYHKDDKFILMDFIQYITEQYDVILFDCQAGYVDLLKILLPYVDLNLFVMEADAISSASIRSLYLKIGDIITEKKVYQVFNKATSEEYEIYSKISGGTVFTNIETVMFDWKIRKAFSIAQIPDMNNTSVDYGMQIFNICRILFPEETIHEKLMKYESAVKLNEYMAKKELLETEIRGSSRQFEKIRLHFFKYFNIIIVPIMTILMIFFLDNKMLNILYESTTALILFGASMVGIWASICLVFYDTIKDRKYRYTDLKKNKRDLEKIENEIEQKKRILESLKKDS